MSGSRLTSFGRRTIRRLCCRNLWLKYKRQKYPRGTEQEENRATAHPLDSVPQSGGAHKYITYLQHRRASFERSFHPDGRPTDCKCSCWDRRKSDRKRDQLVARLIRAAELEISGQDQAETDSYLDTGKFRFRGPDGLEARPHQLFQVHRGGVR